MTIKDYYKSLERHDWYYYMSDSGSSFVRGKAEEERLEGLTEGNKAFKTLFEKFKAYKFSGLAFGRPQVSKPEVPGE